MANKNVEREVFLEGLRAKWYTLDEPDYKFNVAGVYGVGAVLDEAAAALLNKTIRFVENESGEIGRSYDKGEVLKANMTAQIRDKKTKALINFVPMVLLPDLTPAPTEDVKKLGRNSKFRLKVSVKSYAQVGKPIAEVGPDGQETGRETWPTGCRAGGVSVKFRGLQILTFDAGEPTPEESGFSAVSDNDQTGDY